MYQSTRRHNQQDLNLQEISHLKALCTPVELWCACHIAAVFTEIIRGFPQCKANYRAQMEEGNG